MAPFVEAHELAGNVGRLKDELLELASVDCGAVVLTAKTAAREQGDDSEQPKRPHRAPA